MAFKKRTPALFQTGIDKLYNTIKKQEYISKIIALIPVRYGAKGFVYNNITLMRRHPLFPYNMMVAKRPKLIVKFFYH